MPLITWSDELSIGIPKIDTEHQKLVEKVVKFQQDFIVSRRRITRDMMEFLKYWLTNHIMVDDKAFGKYYVRVTS